jgi:hypothetical protein
MAKSPKKPAQPKTAPSVSSKKGMAPEKKRKLIKWGVITFVVLFISIFFVAPRGSKQYGICKTFVELSESYPLEIVPLSVDDFVPIGGPVKIYYKRIDPFGVESVNTIECTFKRDVAGNPLNELQKVDINGKARTYNAEDPEYIKKFNIGIQSLLDYNPDLILPSFSLDNIKEYKDTD